MAGDATVLRGSVEQVVFTKPESGWTILRLVPADGGAQITVVGTLPNVSTGAQLELTGRWETTAKYGRQFRAEHAVPLTPKTTEGIQQYLSSGLVEGVGPALAERLVEAFGADTLDVIHRSPERLTEVDGIGAVRAERIRQALASQLGLQSTMVFLHGLGLSPGLAATIHRRYGNETINVVRSTPFRVALDVRGVGFMTADRIAAKVGVDRASPQRLQAGLLHALAQAAQDGHVFLPRSVLYERARKLLEHGANLDEALGELAAADFVVVPPGAADMVYARPLFEAETQVVETLSRLVGLRAGPLVEAPEDAVRAYEAEAGVELAPGQKTALLQANTVRVLVVTGGPGTGKTTLVKGLLRLFAAAGTKVQLAAPTGRAAQRMSEATGLEARTLHRLLAYDPGRGAFMHDEDHPLTAEALVIDEMSMVDLPLMAAVSAALPDRIRLVLVGDVDQLPSVGPGQVLKDLIDSDRVPVVRLQTVFRQQGGSRIIQNAHRINLGQFPDLTTGPDLTDFYMIERTSPQSAQGTLIHIVSERIPASFSVDPVDDIQVLTPMHKGDLGAQTLNQRLQATLNPDGPSLSRGAQTFRVGDKVIQTRNNYDLGVFNGDIGRLAYIDRDRQRMRVVFDDREVTYETKDQDALSLAYALSIHKSQGSEYPVVVIPVTMQHFVMLHRNLLYTAVTRGKRLVVLIGSRRALKTAINRAEDLGRYSGLRDRLRQAL